MCDFQEKYDLHETTEMTPSGWQVGGQGGSGRDVHQGCHRPKEADGVRLHCC